MNIKFISRKSRASVALGFMLSFLAPPGLAAEFYGIIDTFGKRPRSARMDVSIDTACCDRFSVEFDVFSQSGGSLAQFIAETNLSRGFASSASIVNLVDLTVGQLALVRARTPPSIPAAATLYIDSIGAPMTIGLHPANRRGDGTALSIGREFDVALGNFRSASLLIANVGGTDQVVDVHVGTRAADGAGIYTNPRLPPFGIWRVNLAPSEALSNLIVTSTGAIIVQVVIDDGRGLQSFQVLPSQ